jgi:DNA-binding Lrp family transcriptional regulator
MIMRTEILRMMEKNSKIDIHELAILLGTDETLVFQEIEKMENEGVICGYPTLINWDKTDLEKVSALIDEPSDVFISMIDNGDYPIDFLSKCAKARFKIGRCEFEGHAYDMVISGNPTEDLISDSRKIFAAIKDFLTKVR